MNREVDFYLRLHCMYFRFFSTFTVNWMLHITNQFYTSPVQFYSYTILIQILTHLLSSFSLSSFLSGYILTSLLLGFRLRQFLSSDIRNYHFLSSFILT